MQWIKMDRRLCTGVRFGVLFRLQSLLQEDAQINAADSTGYQTTHFAAQFGQTAFLYYVVSKMLTPMFLTMMGEAPCIGLLTKILLIVYVFCYFLMLIEDAKIKKVALLFTGLLIGVTWRPVPCWYRQARKKT